jgi:hypothetical protein
MLFFVSKFSDSVDCGTMKMLSLPSKIIKGDSCSPNQLYPSESLRVNTKGIVRVLEC